MSDNIFMSEHDSVQTQIDSALAPVNSAISDINTALDGKYDQADVYTKGEVDTAIGAVSSSVDAHTANSDIHVTASKKEEWNAKYGSEDAYTKVQCDERFAPISVAAQVTELSTNKANASNVYTKGEAEAAIKKLSGSSFNYSDWTNGNLALAIKTIFEKFGGAIG